MTKRVVLIGHPVAHSLSGAMQQAAFDDQGIDATYELWDRPPIGLADAVEELRSDDFLGANVTIPHKLAALRVATSASPAARAVGAANTLTFADGEIAAENTDAGGLIDAFGRPLAGAAALVLGAGGAGRAAAWALREAGARVAVWNRTPERARALADELGVAAAEDEAPGSRATGALDVLVNATSVGLEPSVADADALAALGLSGADAPPLVVDLVYRGGGEPTPVAAWALGGGAELVDGLEVLVRQGARSFSLWTGLEAPLDAMRAAARPA